MVVAVVGRGLFPLAMQKLLVAPTELTRETPYLRYHILATRQAWGLDSVETRELNGEADLTLADIRANAPTIDNVRLWDRDPLLQTFGQLQEIRTYYDFVSRGRRPLLDRREVPAGPALAAGAQRGVAPDPDLHQRAPDVHPRDGAHARPGQPGHQRRPAGAVHQGPAAGLDRVAQGHPAADLLRRAGQRVRVRADAAAGVRPSRRARRTSTPPTPERAASGSATCSAGSLLAARFGSSKILLSQDITNDSRVLYYRHIVERAERALPFLRFDRDPYLVIAADGTLKWILDAYTTSDGYPYAEPAARRHQLHAEQRQARHRRVRRLAHGPT